MSAATVALGPCEREGEQRRVEARERVRERSGLRGVAREAQGDEGKRQEAGGGLGVWARIAATRLSSYWREVEDD